MWTCHGFRDPHSVNQSNSKNPLSPFHDSMHRSLLEWYHLSLSLSFPLSISPSELMMMRRGIDERAAAIIIIIFLVIHDHHHYFQDKRMKERRMGYDQERMTFPRISLFFQMKFNLHKNGCLWKDGKKVYTALLVYSSFLIHVQFRWLIVERNTCHLNMTLLMIL